MSCVTRRIDFSTFGGPVYCGRERSQEYRLALDLDALDKTHDKAIVHIPDNTYTVSSSFFLGLFGKSVITAGSAEVFFEKYVFDVAPGLIRSFHGYANNALASAAIRRKGP